MKKSITIRIPKYKKDFFKYEKNKLLEEIDKLYKGEIKFRRIETFDLYDERVTFTIDELYYNKLKEIAKKYNTNISAILRSISLSLR